MGMIKEWFTLPMKDIVNQAGQTVQEPSFGKFVPYGWVLSNSNNGVGLVLVVDTKENIDNLKSQTGSAVVTDKAGDIAVSLGKMDFVKTKFDIGVN